MSFPVSAAAALILESEATPLPHSYRNLDLNPLPGPSTIPADERATARVLRIPLRAHHRLQPGRPGRQPGTRVRHRARVAGRVLRPGPGDADPALPGDRPGGPRGGRSRSWGRRPHPHVPDGPL